MKRILHLAMLLGAILGLLGQGAAVASARPCPEMAAVQVTKDDACAKMKAAKPDAREGKHVPLGCAGMVGCIAPATISPVPTLAGQPLSEPLAAVWPSPPSHPGRSVAPAQEPPATLL